MRIIYPNYAFSPKILGAKGAADYEPLRIIEGRLRYFHPYWVTFRERKKIYLFIILINQGFLQLNIKTESDFSFTGYHPKTKNLAFVFDQVSLKKLHKNWKKN
jgi:hypothetical protein